MEILAIDDERIVLQVLVTAIQEAVPAGVVHAFQSAEEALEFAGITACEVAFLDIQLCETSGISLAKSLKMLCPQMNIVFVTGFAQYSDEAWMLHASGYLQKPVTKQKILAELANLRYPIQHSQVDRLSVQAFGNFEVFVHGQPLHFASAKAKELLALLVDRQGAVLSTAEVAAVLWENDAYSTLLKNRVQKAVMQLRATLQSENCAHILFKQHNQIAIRTELLDCDFYRFSKGDTSVINAFRGEYMTQYSWAEYTTALLCTKK